MPENQRQAQENHRQAQVFAEFNKIRDDLFPKNYGLNKFKALFKGKRSKEVELDGLPFISQFIEKIKINPKNIEGDQALIERIKNAESYGDLVSINQEIENSEMKKDQNYLLILAHLCKGEAKKISDMTEINALHKYQLIKDQAFKNALCQFCYENNIDTIGAIVSAANRHTQYFESMMHRPLNINSFVADWIYIKNTKIHDEAQKIQNLDGFYKHMDEFIETIKKMQKSKPIEGEAQDIIDHNNANLEQLKSLVQARTNTEESKSEAEISEGPNRLKQVQPQALVLDQAKINPRIEVFKAMVCIFGIKKGENPEDMIRKAEIQKFLTNRNKFLDFIKGKTNSNIFSQIYSISINYKPMKDPAVLALCSDIHGFKQENPKFLEQRKKVTENIKMALFDENNQLKADADNAIFLELIFINDGLLATFKTGENETNKLDFLKDKYSERFEANFPGSAMAIKLLPILKGLRKNEANLSAKKNNPEKLRKTIKDDIARLTPYFYHKTLARMQNVLEEVEINELVQSNSINKLVQSNSINKVKNLLIGSKLKNDQESEKYKEFENRYLQSMLYGQDLFSKMFLLEELNAAFMEQKNIDKFIVEYTQEISESASVGIIKHIFSDEAGTFKGYYGVKLNDLRRFVYRQTCQNKAYSFCLDYDYFLTLSADTFNPNNRKPIYLGFKLKDQAKFEKKVKEVEEQKENTKYKGVPNIEDAIKSDLIAEDIRQIFSESDSELTLEHIVLDKKMLIGLYKQALSQDLPPNIKTRLSKAIYEKYLGRNGSNLFEVFDNVKSKKNISPYDLDLLYLINPDECLNFINKNPELFKSNSLKQHRLVRFKKFFEKGSNLPDCINSPEIHNDKNLYAFIKATKEDVNTQDLLQMIKVILDNTKDKLEQASESKGDIDGALKDNALETILREQDQLIDQIFWDKFLNNDQLEQASKSKGDIVCAGALEANTLEAIFDEQGQLIDPIFLELVFKNDKLLNKYIEKNDPKAMESFKDQFPERYKAFSDKLVDNSASKAAKHVPSTKFATADPTDAGANSPTYKDTTISNPKPITPGKKGPCK